MNVQKPAAIVAAMLITAAGMAAIASYSNAAIANANRGADASAAVIHTLPTVNVHPTPEQVRKLRANQAGAAPSNAQMPYYSFANDSAGI
ncbi:MAG TPA: hypothetical protein VN630_02845 [Rhodanobacteraceae bacterium]|nr:hypothetical protein [Rhodanobacteraceae bacterium]